MQAGEETRLAANQSSKIIKWSTVLKYSTEVLTHYVCGTTAQTQRTAKLQVEPQ